MFLIRFTSFSSLCLFQVKLSMAMTCMISEWHVRMSALLNYPQWGSQPTETPEPTSAAMACSPRALLLATSQWSAFLLPCPSVLGVWATPTPSSPTPMVLRPRRRWAMRILGTPISSGPAAPASPAGCSAHPFWPAATPQVLPISRWCAGSCARWWRRIVRRFWLWLYLKACIVTCFNIRLRTDVTMVGTIYIEPWFCFVFQSIPFPAVNQSMNWTFCRSLYISHL